MNSASPAESHFIPQEAYYGPVGNQAALFEAAYANRLQVLLKGPAGCGKTRFMEYMAWRIERPLITVSCHDDLATSDGAVALALTDDEDMVAAANEPIAALF